MSSAPTSAPPVVSGEIYVYADVVDTTGTITVNDVSWWFDDDLRSGPPTFVDPAPPYDFQGGATLAVPFDTGALDPVTGDAVVADGIHSLLVVVDTSAGEFTASGSIDVRNTVASNYSVVVSNRADRSAPTPVARTDGTDVPNPTVTGNIYVFVTPAQGLKKVEFFVDEVAPFTGVTPDATELTAPFDLMSGTSTTANPYNTATLSEGNHTLGVRATTVRNTVLIANGTFVVQNTPTPPTLYKLVASTQSNRGGTLVDIGRSDSVDVADPTLTGNVYIFTTPATADIDHVDFWDNGLAAFVDIRDGTSDHVYNTERAAPFDFVAGGTASAAQPFSMTQYLDGSKQHAASRITLTDGTTRVASGDYIVSNPAGPSGALLPYKPPVLETNPLVGYYYNNPSPTQSVSGVRCKVDVIDTATSNRVTRNAGFDINAAYGSTANGGKGRDMVHLLPGQSWQKKNTAGAVLATYSNDKQGRTSLEAPYGIGPWNGRNHLIIGGKFDITRDWVAFIWPGAIGGDLKQTNNADGSVTYTRLNQGLNAFHDNASRMIFPDSTAGTVFVEGVEMRNSFGLEGIDLFDVRSELNGTDKLVVQNVYFPRITAIVFTSTSPWKGDAQVAGSHDGGDWIQMQNGSSYWYMHNVTGSTSYQSTWPNAYRGSYGARWPVEWKWSNVNIDEARGTHFTNVGSTGYQVFTPAAISRYNRVVGDDSTKEARVSFPITLNECYTKTLNANRDAGLLGMLGARQKQIDQNWNPTVSGGVATFPTTVGGVGTGITGVWKEGKPPGGDFVVPGVNCGVNYTTPGYDPAGTQT